jgi:transaldolase
MTRIHRLEELGQSIWLDFIDRELVTTGALERMIDDGLRGLTSNPTIFQKAIAAFTEYDDLIEAASPAESGESVLERLMVRDLVLACDKLRPVYDATAGGDGFASIEVSPAVAEDCAASVEQASRLWSLLRRPNLMVKIPGTRAALPAIESCLSHGININVTLLFSVARYREVVEAYMRALEARAARGAPLDSVASVASFFVSRVDTKVDKALDALAEERHAIARALRGRIAIANAKIAYEEYERLYSSERWRRLAAQGARTQRLLWASTSPKDPAYPLLYYVEALVGSGTVDTVTPELFLAYLDHGNPELRLARDREQAHEQLASLSRLGIDLARIADELEDEGIAAFARSHDEALRSLEKKRQQMAARTRGAAARGTSRAATHAEAVMKLSEVMTRNVHVISGDTTVREAARKMCEANVGVLPVCENDRITGVVTDRDLVVRSVARGDDPDKTRATDTMTREVEWAFEDETIEEASKKMSERQIQRLLVLNRDKRLVGIVSLADLARAHAAPTVTHTLEEIKAPTKPSAAGAQAQHVGH